KASPMTFTVEMQSNSSGSGQIFWKEIGLPYNAVRSQVFDVTHDGNVHTYSIQLSPKGPVQGVRIDPSNGEGQIQIQSMRLLDDSGVTIHEWTFADAIR
ncbi:MAG: N-acetylgalactosamine-6-sulfatase, partial [Rhodopirellula bahusiensis]